MDDTTKDSVSDPTDFDMTATLRGLNCREDVIRAFKQAQEWRKAHPWEWPTGNEEWFDTLKKAGQDIGLVYGGATKIKQYVFEAPKLPEIRGASAILDRINLVDLRLLWDQQGLTRQMIIYASGGNILGFAPTDVAPKLAQKIEKTYTRETLLANSVAVSHTFSLLEILFGVNAGTYGLDEFSKHWKNSELWHTLEKYYYDPPGASDIDEVTRRFINRKNFGEIITVLATMANRRREGLGSSADGNPLRRDIAHYPILPLAQKCQTSDIRTAVLDTRGTLPDPTYMSEASARKAYVGRVVKGAKGSVNWFENVSSWRFRVGENGATETKSQDDKPFESWEKRWETWLTHDENGTDSNYAKSSHEHNIQAAQDVDDIGAASKGRASRYVGLIYADGDRVGQRIATLRTPDEFAEFSQKLSDAAKNAVFKALGEHLTPYKKKDGTHHPFEILSIGGDDLIILVPGDKALEIAATIAYEFEQAMTEQAGERTIISRYQDATEPNFSSYNPDIGISAGVLIAPENTPIFFMQKLTEELQKNAKKLAKNSQSKGGVIDFMILKSITMVTDQLNTFRRKTYNVGEPSSDGLSAEFTARPFLWHELVGLLATVRGLKKARLPRSQLYRINEVVQDKNNPSPVFPSILEFLYTSVRQEPTVQTALQQLREKWRNGENKQQNPAIPWLKNTRIKDDKTIAYWETIWPDIVEIYDFVEQKEQLDA